MQRAVLIVGLMAASLAGAATPPEPAVARLEAVDVASRQVVAGGTTWALAATVRVQVPGRSRASVRDLAPGMNVRMNLAPATGEMPVVSAITVLPD